jgi:hypothetical protein
MKTADFVQDNNTYLRVTGHIQLAHRGTKAKAPPSRHPLTWLGETEPRICQCPNAIDRGFAGSAPVALRPRRDGLHQLCIDRVSFPWRIRHDSATASWRIFDAVPGQPGLRRADTHTGNPPYSIPPYSFTATSPRWRNSHLLGGEMADPPSR